VNSSDPLMMEAFRHGRTQERLHQAVECLRSIRELCRDGKGVGLRYRILEIEANCCVTLQRLSSSTGGVIDDMEPVCEPAKEGA
jgi:hypothetical protein